MPIAPHLRHFYRTEAWKDLVAFIRKRSGNRCEWCGKPNGAEVSTRTGKGRMFWRKQGKSLTWRDESGLVVTLDSEDAELMKTLKLRHIRVVCTGAHLNHTPGDDRPENAAFLCQWHHLMFDRGHHKETRKVHKDAKRPLLRLTEGVA